MYMYMYNVYKKGSSFELGATMTHNYNCTLHCLTQVSVFHLMQVNEWQQSDKHQQLNESINVYMLLYIDYCSIRTIV